MKYKKTIYHFPRSSQSSEEFSPITFVAVLVLVLVLLIGDVVVVFIVVVNGCKVIIYGFAMLLRLRVGWEMDLSFCWNYFCSFTLISFNFNRFQYKTYIITTRVYICHLFFDWKVILPWTPWEKKRSRRNIIQKI